MTGNLFKTAGAGCSKLTLLVNVSLKFLNLNITKTLLFFCWKNVRIFCTAKDPHIFPTKNNSIFDNVVRIYLMS